MPTYDYQCQSCRAQASHYQSIASYCSAPVIPVCNCGHGPMERRLSVVPSSGLSNALAGDRHYENLRGPNGEDLSSRTKHREFMRASGLTTADDFASSWSKANSERETFRAGKHEDKELRKEITEKVMTAVAQPD